MNNKMEGEAGDLYNNQPGAIVCLFLLANKILLYAN
jgi:hypothetical protein